MLTLDHDALVTATGGVAYPGPISPRPFPFPLPSPTIPLPSPTFPRPKPPGGPVVDPAPVHLAR